MAQTTSGKILIFDRDGSGARLLGPVLTRRNFDVASASNAEEALRALKADLPNVLVIDSNVLTPAGGGLALLEKAHQLKPDVPIVVISGSADPELAFRVSKLGADDFMVKPVEPGDFESRITRLVERGVAKSLPKPATEHVHAEFAMLFGASPTMEDVKSTIEKVADTNATVLIRGESGTGKEMVARMVYSQSGRNDKPFVKVNCAAIPYELLESELFGYEQGAFTGANRQKPGKFDQANSGTIFLDEISEMHPSLQAKLLHVLQDGEFSRLGGKHDIAVDVRVLAATNKPLEQAVSQGSFREDLFYRLNVVSIHIPPLRERREEIPIFLDFFLAKYSEYYNKHPAPFSEMAIARMMEYDWPGNIRELENLVKRYTIVGNEAQITRELATHKPIRSSRPEPHEGKTAAPGSAPPKLVSLDGQPSLLEIGRQAATKAEREAIERVLLQTKWNRRQAAKILKISYKALLNKLKLFEEQDEGSSEQQPA
jgi:two-component system response regulator AtoC